MTAKEYITTFNMDSEDKTQFDHTAFLNAFAQEFNSLVDKTKTYDGFQHSVSIMDAKFREILQIRAKKYCLSNRLWKAFFAIYVVPKRKQLYPERQKQIEAKRNGKNHN